jgi:hypothetical protein
VSPLVQKSIRESGKTMLTSFNGDYITFQLILNGLCAWMLMNILKQIW